MPDYRMLIGGELVAGGDTMYVINPATGQSFAKVPPKRGGPKSRSQNGRRS